MPRFGGRAFPLIIRPKSFVYSFDGLFSGTFGYFDTFSIIPTRF